MLQLQARIDKLPEDVKTLCANELATIDPSWLILLLEEIQKPYFTKVSPLPISPFFHFPISTLSD